MFGRVTVAVEDGGAVRLLSRMLKPLEAELVLI